MVQSYKCIGIQCSYFVEICMILPNHKSLTVRYWSAYLLIYTYWKWRIKEMLCWWLFSPFSLKKKVPFLRGKISSPMLWVTFASAWYFLEGPLHMFCLCILPTFRFICLHDLPFFNYTPIHWLKSHRSRNKYKWKEDTGQSQAIILLDIRCSADT